MPSRSASSSTPALSSAPSLTRRIARSTVASDPFQAGREGRRLWPAAQARSIPSGLGGSGGRVVFDILAVRVAHRADGPTLDAGRAHAREKTAVIACVAADPSAVAFLEI